MRRMPTTPEDFLQRVVADTGGMAVTILAAIGDRLGFFKDLSTAGPSTFDGVAARTGAHPRYVREWLRAMVAAGYVEYDPNGERFSLPDAHAPVLAEEGGALFAGGTHQMLLGMLSVLRPLQDAFLTGAGIPAGAYHGDTWEGMQRDMEGVYRTSLIEQWIPAMPAVKAMLERGARVADIGCGSGRTLILMAQAFPKCTCVGYDVFAPVVERATANALTAGVAQRVHFQVVDAAEGIPEKYDLITTFDVVHDAPRPLELLQRIRAALNPGGRYVCMDVNCSDRLEENVGPVAALRYGFSVFYCMPISLASGGEGLGTMGLPESKIRDLCAHAGFSSFRRVPLEGSIHSVYEATRS